MKVTHKRGAVCEYCHRAIGDIGSDINAIYTVASWFNPERQLKLCRKDLEAYQQYVNDEKQGLANLVKEIGFNVLTERQKSQYKN